MGLGELLPVFEPIMAVELVDVGLVFLLNAGLITFISRLRVGLVAAMFIKSALEMVVQELAAIVAIHSE